MTLRANYQKYTKSSEARLQAMRDCLLAIERDELAGDVVECGVWRGGNIILARKLAPARTCWLFDTFAGMTTPTELDVKPNGARALDSFRAKTATRPWAAASVEEVRSYLAETDTLDDERLRFIVGPVERTLLEPANLPEHIALLRLDTDWYASTKIELEVLYPRLVAGGWLIVDDFGHWLGARKAVVDYFAGSPVKIVPIDDAGVIVMKPSEQGEIKCATQSHSR